MKVVRAAQPPPHWLYAYQIECPACRALLQAQSPADFRDDPPVRAHLSCAACGYPLLVVKPSQSSGLLRYPWVSVER